MIILVKDKARGPSAPTVVGRGGRPFDQLAQTINRGEAGWSPWILCFDPVCETARDVSRHDNGANNATPGPRSLHYCKAGGTSAHVRSRALVTDQPSVVDGITANPAVSPL